MLKKIKKIILSIVMTVVGAFILFILLTVSLSALNNRAAGDKQEILSASGASAKKALVVYQPSRGQGSSKIAHEIAKGLNESGYEVTLNHPTEQLSADVSQYSVVVLGSPVIAGKPSAALENYIKGVKDLSSKKVVIYTLGSLKEEIDLDALQKDLGDVKPYEKVKFKTADSKTNEKTAYELGKKIAGEK